MDLIARCYGDKPARVTVSEIIETGALVYRTNPAYTIGFRWEWLYSYDKSTYIALSDCWESGDHEELEALWNGMSPITWYELCPSESKSDPA